MEKIVIIEDQKIVLDGLKSIIEEDSEYKVVNTFIHPEKALSYIRKNKDIDLAIIDVRLPQISGVDLIEFIKGVNSKIKIILITQHASFEFIDAGIKNIADGLLLKCVSSTELLNAIDIVIKGGKYYCKDSSKAMAKHINNLSNNNSLTSREIEVAKLIAKGLSAFDIGNSLNIKESTVNFHKKNIKSKLNLTKTSEITTFAFKNGLVDIINT